MLIDVTRLIQRALKGMLPTGVDRVGQAYVDHYAGRAEALIRLGDKWAVPEPKASARLFHALLGRGRGARRHLAWATCRALAALPSRTDHRLLLHTGHSGLDRPGFAREIHRRDLRAIYFAHDLIPITHPEFCRTGEDQRHHRRIRTMIQTGKALIVNSQSTRTTLADYASAHGMRLPDCVVAPLAPAALPPPSTCAPLSHDYFVVLGTIEPRKNHNLLLQIWPRLIEQLGAAAPKLVVIGRRGWKCQREIELLDRSTALKQHLVVQPRCQDQDLANWLGHAKALLFPSFAEGFGLPLVEALSLGVPAIVSDLPVFREIAGAIPEFLDPLDEAGWCRAIRDFVDRDDMRRQRQLERMQAYRAPSWRGHFETVDVLLDRWLQRPGRSPTHSGWVHAPRY